MIKLLLLKIIFRGDKMTEKEYKFKSIEEYRAYQREISKKWYERNKEKKKAYARERYYKLKAKEINQ